MSYFKLRGLFVALLASAALANPVKIPRRNVPSKDNGNGFSYRLPTLPDIVALPTNVQECGFSDHLPTLAGPTMYAAQHTHAPTEEQVNVKEEKAKRTSYITLCPGGLRDNCYGPITLPILPDWTSEAIETTTTTSSSKAYGTLSLAHGASRPASAHNPSRTGNLLTDTNDQREVVPSFVTSLRTEAYGVCMAAATEYCNTTLSGPPHRSVFIETTLTAPSTTTEASVSWGNLNPSLSSSLSHPLSAPTITQGLFNFATVTGTGTPPSMITHVPRVPDAENHTTTSTNYSFPAPFSSYPGCTYTRMGQLAPMQNGPVKIEWYSTTTETVYGNCYGCAYTFHDVRPHGYGATGDNGKRFTTTIHSRSVVTVLTPTCVPTPWPTWWTNA